MANFIMHRGDTKILDFTVIDEDGVAVDLDGTVWFTAKNDQADADADAVIALSSGSLGGVTINSPTTLGTGYVTIPPSATTALTETTILQYDLQIKSAAGQIFTVASGELEVTPDITRATS